MNSEGLKLKKFSKYEGKILHSCINSNKAIVQNKSAGNFFSDLIDFMWNDPIVRQSLKRIAVPPRCLFINLSSPKQMSQRYEYSAISCADKTAADITVCEDIMDLFSVSEAQGMPRYIITAQTTFCCISNIIVYFSQGNDGY